jgi:mRNA interferase RelE/StbE
MNWSVQIKRSAVKELSRITRADRLRIVAAIDDLANHPYRGSALKGDLTGLRRIRIGPYRVIYEVRETELVVLVISAGHRKAVYRKN